MIEIVSKTQNHYSFTIRAKSGQVLLHGSEFDDEKAVKQVFRNIASLQFSRNNIERKTNHSGQFLFLLKEDYGSVIGQSQLYDSEMGMENGIKNLINRIEELKKEGRLKLI
ncbi:YegP family protein [Euzebyella saccharophila]|uniref:YegP family protein n=1 Tax=Euzebyella saccharophila TaxID=679664 RepID=A0ABV8JTE2_9FLAO|nr:DUF1508 domain-containing protein [Euzebyella saccharophila]